MKTFQIIVLLFLLFTTGCIREDMHDCRLEKGNITVHFSLKDQTNNQIFLSVVDNVALFVYDMDGKLVTRNVISKNELSIFSGKHLQLTPGTYIVIAGANITDTYSKLITNNERPFHDIDQNYLLNAVPVNGVVENSDPLYYAPKNRSVPLTVTVPAAGSAEVTAEFRHAHVKVDITVEGYDHLSSRATADPLRVELTDITSRYCFGMVAHGDRVNYVRYAKNTDFDNKVFNTLFNIPVFNKSTTTHIRVTNSAGELIVSPISLRELLGDTIEYDEIQYLPVKIVFTEENGSFKATVVVDLPEWGGDDVKPNI